MNEEYREEREEWRNRKSEWSREKENINTLKQTKDKSFKSERRNKQEIRGGRDKSKREDKEKAA